MARKINSLIALLDDNDSEVLEAVTNELLREGTTVIPALEKAWESSPSNQMQERLENVIHYIQFVSTRKRLKAWMNGGAEDLLEGAIYVAQFQYPYISYESINKEIGKISQDIYLSKGNNLSAVEKVKLLNYVIYELNNFNRNTANFYSPQNSFINQVIESRKGNPISLGIIYIAVAHRLGLPIYGVNLPKSFVLAYMDELRHYESEDISNDVLFYINPYNKGTILNRREIEYFIKQQSLETKPDYYVPCDNKSIIVRLITNLMIAYQKVGFEDKIKLLQGILSDISKDIKLS